MGLQNRETRKIASLRRRLLNWYAKHKRDLPWRKSSEPYAIWVSEIMLQQTRVAAVMDRYEAFLERFATVVALAEAREEDVLALWSGLGYYRRARMLHKAAGVVVGEFGGEMPVRAEALRGLPGIGAYTAAAIASIAHGERVAVVDGNVERVVCRLEGWEADGTTARKKSIEGLAAWLVDPVRPGDFNQAMMELGALVCTPRSPLCGECPLYADCDTHGEHKTVARAAMKSQVVGYALCMRGDEVLLERRPDTQSVMPGMWELPALRDFAFEEDSLTMTVKHAIMQVNYVVRVRTVTEKELKRLTVVGGERRWVRGVDAKDIALTGLARKVLKKAGLLS